MNDAAFRPNALRLFAAHAYRSFLKRVVPARPMFILPGDGIGNSVLATGGYEMKFLDALFYFFGERLNAAESCVVDVGANIGTHTLYFSRRFRRVVSFEPSSILFPVLTANLRLNKIDNVTAVESGLGSITGTKAFVDGPASNTGLSRFADEGERRPIVTGDDYFASWDGPPISLVKIDTEGHEAQVIAGIMGTLRRHRPVVAFEYYTAARTEAIARLREVGYRSFGALHRTGLPPRYRFGEADLTRELPNVVAVP